MAALTSAIISLYSPWWSEDYHLEEDKREYRFSWGLNEISFERVISEDWNRYLCPSCGNPVADTEDELMEERDYCPDCGYYVGQGMNSCRWCEASFEKAAVKCDECDKLAVEPKKEIFREEGDIEKETQPLSNTEIKKAQKEDGIINRVGVSNKAHIIWLIGICIAALSVLVIIISGLYKRLHKPVIISMGIASVLLLVGVVYFSASWSGAYEDDWNDVYGDMELYREKYDSGENYGLFTIADDEYKPVPVVNSFSGYKKHQSEVWYRYYIEYRWGPRSGWIIGLISSLLLTGTTVLLFLFRNDLIEDGEEYEDEEDDEDEEDKARYKEGKKREKSKSAMRSKYPPPPPEKKCTKCRGVIMDPKAVFCHICGASQAPSSSSPVAAASTTRSSSDTSSKSLQTSPQFANCPKCGALNQRSADSCMMCGRALKGTGAKTQSSNPAHSMLQRYTYPPPQP